MTIGSISVGNRWNYSFIKPSLIDYNKGRVSGSDTIQKAANTLRTKMANSRAELDAGAVRQNVFSSYTMDDKSGVNVINAVDDCLSQTQGILERIKDLSEQASNPALCQQDRAQMQEEMEELLNRLNQLSDTTGAGLLDGSYAGVVGEDGVKAMGIDSIKSDGLLNGQAKFYIENKDGRFSITARINGETITNTLTSSDRETTFKLSNGQKITLEFSKGTRCMQTGVITDVQFNSSSAKADLKNAMSADKTRKRVTIIAAEVDDIFYRAVNMPALLDTSAIGFGLHGLDISTLSGAKEMAAKATSALNKVGNRRNELAQAKMMVLDPDKAPLRRRDQHTTEGTLLSNVIQNMKAQSQEAVLAQASQLSRTRALSLLTA